MEIQNIDHNELSKQLEIEALNSKKYITFKAFIGANMKNPISSLELCDPNAYQMIQIMCVLKHTLDDLAQTYPELYAEVLRANVSATVHKEVSTFDEEDIDDMN